MPMSRPAEGLGARAGFKDLHSFAFLGGSGRVGTAQDGIYAYVPAGPHKQFDMFLHSYAAYKAGRMKARAARHRTALSFHAIWPLQSLHHTPTLNRCILQNVSSCTDGGAETGVGSQCQAVPVAHGRL